MSARVCMDSKIEHFRLYKYPPSLYLFLSKSHQVDALGPHQVEIELLDTFFKATRASVIVQNVHLIATCETNHRVEIKRIIGCPCSPCACIHTFVKNRRKCRIWQQGSIHWNSSCHIAVLGVVESTLQKWANISSLQFQDGEFFKFVDLARRPTLCMPGG